MWNGLEKEFVWSDRYGGKVAAIMNENHSIYDDKMPKGWMYNAFYRTQSLMITNLRMDPFESCSAISKTSGYNHY
jgi:hypothetical protein